MRALLFSERLGPPFDEGVKNVALNLGRQVAKSHQILTLTTGGENTPDLRIENLPAVNRLLWSHQLSRRIRSFAPDRICYLPTASMTPWSFLRALALSRHGGGKPVTMIALQPRRVTAVTRAVMARGFPERIIVQSERTARHLAGLGTRVVFVPVGVDRDRFSPAKPGEREALRHRFGIDVNAKAILHVGHINRNRNVQVLAAIQRLDGVQTVVLGSTSTGSDPALAAELAAAGVLVISRTIADPEALYRLADLYVFPCPPDRPIDQTPAIETPLSVLEAMACNLPVVISRFGGLPSLFEPGDGIIYVENPHDGEQWCRAALLGLAAGRGHTRVRTTPYPWQNFADAVLGLEGPWT
ncbi:MAG: glycosyltransferase family 4 protein [Acidobacteriota bacterium]